jgi:hypothetical protein
MPRGLVSGVMVGFVNAPVPNSDVSTDDGSS